MPLHCSGYLLVNDNEFIIDNMNSILILAFIKLGFDRKLLSNKFRRIAEKHGFQEKFDMITTRDYLFENRLPRHLTSSS